jgi:hypothetical protein
MTSDTDVLVGRSKVYAVAATASCIFTIAFAIFVGSQRSAWTALIFLPLILGVTSGYGIAGGALAQVEVFPDHVVLTNMFRIIWIDRAAVFGLQTASGIYVMLKNGRFFSITAFSPTLGKRLITENEQGRAFGQRMAEILGVEADVHRPVPQTLPKEYVQIRLRKTTPGVMVLCGVTAIAIAVLIRLI